MDIEALQQRLSDLDSSMVKQSSFLEALLADGSATAEMITEQHGYGERAESGLGDGKPGVCGYGGSSDGVLLSVELDYYKRHRKKRLRFEGRLIVQPA